METPHLWVGTRLLRMKTPLRGRSGGHTGAAPTISRVAPCPKGAGEWFAEGLGYGCWGGMSMVSMPPKGVMRAKASAGEMARA